MPENCEKAMRAGIIEMTGKPTDIKIHRLLGRDATEH
jgi:hypothetical protein